MQDANWKTWGLIVLLALGLLAEVMKHFPGSGGHMPWEESMPRLGSPTQPYSVKLIQGRDHQPTQPTARVGALHGGITREQLQKFVAANTPTATTFDHDAKPDADGKKAEAKDAKKEECDEKNPKIDAKTGKPIACKKKKEKKKAEDKEVATAEQPKPQPSTDDNKDSINNAITQAAGNGQIPQPISDQPDNAFDSLENWERRLLGTPDLTETKRFIDHYQRNLVTADIFYKITQEMLSDSRADMRSLGVLCAGLTPSVVSFQLLAQLSKSERSDSPVRQQAEEFLTRYADLSNINILDRVLRSPTASYATVVAAQKLDVAARRYLTINSSSTATPSQLSVAHAKNVTYFSRFLSVLQDLERSTDSTVAAQSRTTLADLQSLLGTPTAPADPTAPAGGKAPIAPVPAASQTAQQ